MSRLTNNWVYITELYAFIIYRFYNHNIALIFWNFSTFAIWIFLNIFKFLTFLLAILLLLFLLSTLLSSALNIFRLNILDDLVIYNIKINNPGILLKFFITY